jgi:hypothetical protein
VKGSPNTTGQRIRKPSVQLDLFDRDILSCSQQPPTFADQEALIPTTLQPTPLSNAEFERRVAGSERLAQSRQRLESAASAVFVDWQHVVQTIDDAALQSNGQIFNKLWVSTESFGKFVGSDDLLASRSDPRVRFDAMSSRSRLIAAADHHLSVVNDIKRSMEHEHNAKVRRASVRIARPSANLTAALAAFEPLSANLNAELREIRDAFEERFADDLEVLRNARDLGKLASETGIPLDRLTEAQTTLHKLDAAETRNSGHAQ